MSMNWRIVVVVYNCVCCIICVCIVIIWLMNHVDLFEHGLVPVLGPVHSRTDGDGNARLIHWSNAFVMGSFYDRDLLLFL